MELFDRYSTIIHRLMQSTETLGIRIINNSFYRTITSFEELLVLTEISGKQRALIASLLQKGESDKHIENRLVSLEKDHENLHENFFQHATIHTIQIYRKFLDKSLEERYNRIRREIIFSRRFNLIDSRSWWSLATRYINSLYRIDFSLLGHLNRLKEAQKNDAIRTLGISIVIWIVFVAFLYLLLLYSRS